jgi:hypothetical protein
MSSTVASGESPAPQLHLPTSTNTLAAAIRLGRAYPYPHSVLGGDKAEEYVRRLAERASYPGEGWYGFGVNGIDVVAFLSLYGAGDATGHTLWKIRHPLPSGSDPVARLAALLEEMVRLARRHRAGTAKFVSYLSEHEQDAIEAALQAGFRVEGFFDDYYRLGEKTLVVGRTAL